MLVVGFPVDHHFLPANCTQTPSLSRSCQARAMQGPRFVFLSFSEQTREKKLVELRRKTGRCYCCISFVVLILFLAVPRSATHFRCDEKQTSRISRRDLKTRGNRAGERQTMDD